ncbi:MAG TPA: basic secretory protein-like protein [Polyangia bacterium]
MAMSPVPQPSPSPGASDAGTDASMPTQKTANLISKGDPLMCLGVANFPDDLGLQTTPCNDQSLGQLFLVTSDGRFTFPAWSSTSPSGVAFTAGAYCLASKPAAGAQTNSSEGPALVLCDPADKAQRWDTRGNALVSQSENTCLATSQQPGGNAVTMQACLPEAPHQEWIAGSPREHGPKTVQFVSNHDRYSCIRVIGFPETTTIKWESCDLREGYNSDRKFLLDAAGAIRYPAVGPVTSKGKVYPVGSQCLSTRPGAQNLVLVPCDPNDLKQRWTRNNDVFVSKATDGCLSRSDGTDYIDSVFPDVRALPCTAGNTLQSWTTGDFYTLEAARIQSVKDKKTPIETACKAPPIIKFIERDPDKTAVQRVRRIFGGDSGLRTALSTAYQDICRILYTGHVEAAPYRTELHVVFKPTLEGAMMNYTRIGGIALIHVNDGAILGDRSSDVDYGAYLTGVWHHELAHANQAHNGPPSYLIEGLADWAVLQKPSVRRFGPRTAGGKLTDGYQRVAYFLTWLDSKYTSQSDPRKFTLRLNSAIFDGDMIRKQWNLDWFVEQTGKDINALWTDYQAAIM